jgi:hypothetical protein
MTRHDMQAMATCGGGDQAVTGSNAFSLGAALSQ